MLCAGSCALVSACPSIYLHRRSASQILHEVLIFKNSMLRCIAPHQATWVHPKQAGMKPRLNGVGGVQDRGCAGPLPQPGQQPVWHLLAVRCPQTACLPVTTHGQAVLCMAYSQPTLAGSRHECSSLLSLAQGPRVLMGITGWGSRHAASEKSGLRAQLC